MLGGERQRTLETDLPYKPPLSETFGASVERSFAQLDQLSGYIFPGLSTDKQRQRTAERLQDIDEITSDPRLGKGQQRFDQVGSLVGSLLPTLPFSVVGGAVGGLAAGAVGFGARTIALAAAEEGANAPILAYAASQVPLSKLATGALSHYLPEKSIAAITTGIAEGYTGYKGMIIPEHFSEHYDAINNTLDVNHAIQDWGSDNYGFLYGAIPLAAGYIAFKGIRGVIKQRNAAIESKAVDAELKRVLQAHEKTRAEHAEKQAKVSELQSHLQQAEEQGHISPEHHEWYLDYLENPNDPKVQEGALKVLQSLQIPYDRVTGRVWNQVIRPEAVKNLQTALYDQSLTNFEKNEAQLLSSYILHNELDGYVSNMRENPNLLHAMEGMTHSLGSKIEAQSVALKELDHAITNHLKTGVLKNHIFSQKEIYNHLRKMKVYHPVDVPYEVPYMVRKKLAIERKLNVLKGKKGQKYQTEASKRIRDDLERQIKEMELQTPEQELGYIKDKLIKDGKLSDNFKSMRAYHRLEELSQVWGSARVLLDRIHGEAINIKQRGLNEILKKFIEMVDNNASRLADPDLVKQYLHERIQRAVPISREFKRDPLAVENNEVKENLNPESMYEESNAKTVHESGLEFARDDFIESEKKFRQWTESEKALFELIDCELGQA